MRGINLLIPEARDAAERFRTECHRKGLNVLITDTLRTKDEQNALYAKGRTAPGQVVTNCKYPYSLHNWGTAFDFCRNEKGREYDNSDGFFDKVGAIAEGLGLVWGGHFRNVDKPHVQLARYAPDKTAAFLIANYSNPDAFIRSKKEESIMTKEDFQNALIDALTPELAVEIVETAIRELAGERASEAWQVDAVAWAADRGVFKGNLSGNLMPQKPVTRAELAQALKNFDAYLTSTK